VYSYFGHAEWPRFAPGLKSIDDATYIRRRVLLAFEQAETTADAAARRRLMTFVLVGAGPTGVELAGALAGMGVELLLNTPIRAIDAGGVTAEGEHIDAATVIWCAGVQATPVAPW